MFVRNFYLTTFIQKNLLCYTITIIIIVIRFV